MNTTTPNTTDTDTTATEPPAPMVWPTLRAHDALALIDFLTDTVGFLRTAVYTDGDQVAHAELSWPEGGAVMLGSYRPEVERCTTPGSFSGYVVTDQVDALHDRLRTAGATITRELADQHYGSREFSIQDPEGNSWSFGTYRGQPRG